MHTKHSLMEDLKKMGLQGTDTIMMHSSMRAIGDVEGRADTVLDALSEYFSEGLLMLPALTWNLADEEDPVFDVRNTPCVVGILPELFRQREHVVRNYHPTHSVSALGKEAKAVLQDTHLDGTPCGLHSAWHRLMERDGYILQVGCTLTSCTFIHGVEEWCDVPDRLEAPVQFTIIKENGEKMQLSSRPHKGSPSEQFWKAEQALREAGALKDGQFGDAKVMVISARGCYEVVKELLRENSDLFGEQD